MNRVLVDTSAYAAFMRGHEGVKEALQRAEEIYLNPVVLGELLAGFQRGKHLRKNDRELRLFLSSPRVGLLPVDEETSERYAVIVNSLRDRGSPIPANDIWIAATAMQHGLGLLTLDSDFDRVDQIVVQRFDVQ